MPILTYRRQKPTYLQGTGMCFGFILEKKGRLDKIFRSV